MKRGVPWLLIGRGGIALLLCLHLVGCVTKIPGADPELLSFLQSGKTTREDVILKLGQPSASFEHERILTYRIGEDVSQGRYIVSPKPMIPWQSVRYSLVLVFDASGHLEKKSLVLVD